MNGDIQAYPRSAVCVQFPAGSRNSAIHSAYHMSLQPSLLGKPRHPSLKDFRQVKDKEQQSTHTPSHITYMKRITYAQAMNHINGTHDLVARICSNTHHTTSEVRESTPTAQTHITCIHSIHHNSPCEWSFRRFTYGNLVTTSPSSKW